MLGRLFSSKGAVFWGEARGKTLIWDVRLSMFGGCFPLFGDFPGGSVVKDPSTSSGDVGSVPGLGRSPGEGNGNPLQYYCLGNLMDRGAWWAIIHGIIRVGHNFVTKPPL